MDVQCERCRTEYEFDDALVSGRGTTVRCTSCGHQFKVRRFEAGAPAADRWTVKTADGHELTFFSLRDLQQAISSTRVRRDDILTQGGGRPRALGSITELEPFFGARAVAPSADGAIERADGPVEEMVFPKRARAWAPHDSPELPFVPSSSTPATNVGEPAREKIETLRPPANAAAAPPPATLIYPRQPRPMPPPTVPVRAHEPREPFEEELGEARPRMASSDETYSVAPRRRVGGWIVAVALLLAAVVVGWATLKPYFVVRDSAASAHLDTRAQAFLMEGERALAEGNTEVAQEDFDKASALAENDARVLLDQARLAAVKADVAWLKVRILPPDAADELRITKTQLAESVVRARRFADEAEAAAPDDVAAQRAKVDALRLAGDLAAARAYAPKVLAKAAQPETAYVLAAMDLAEPEPVWTTVTERLRLAVGAEGTAGRARSALIYALARSGDIEGAKSELAKLDVLPRPFPLLPGLHSFVERSGPKPSAPAVATAAASGRLPSPAPPTRTGSPAPPPSFAEAPADPRLAMQTASQALRRGDFARARQVYESIIDRNPNDSEALSGLGDVSRQQGNLGGAIVDYRRAIAVNPSYLPALLGLADSEWAKGDHAKAVHDYNDIVDRFPEGTYPAYVPKRVQSAAPAPVAEPAGTGSE